MTTFSDAANNNPQTEEDISRRDFLTQAIFAIGGFMGLSLTIPAVGFVVEPALKQQDGEWVRLGRSTQVEIGVPTLFTVSFEKATGWVKSDIERQYYVVTQDGENFSIFSNVCTHLGCRVRWQSEPGSFACPCHDAYFDIDGNVLSGPPPRPLDRATFRVTDDGSIEIGV